MTDTLDWNSKTIAEFRANEGRLGGNFEGAPVVLVHHRGRKSGREYVTPTMYLPHATGRGTLPVVPYVAGWLCSGRVRIMPGSRRVPSGTRRVMPGSRGRPRPAPAPRRVPGTARPAEPATRCGPGRRR
jgi:F420H(2)-dependent quinone reductase